MSTPIRTQRAAGYEDILALPDHVVGEIVDGETHGEGVGHAWLVDPLVRTLEVFRLHPDGGSWLLVSAHSAEEVVRAEPFDGIELRLADLWIAPAAGEPPPATAG